MSKLISFPSPKEGLIIVLSTIFFFMLTGIFIGIRPEHILFVGMFLFMFFLNDGTRKLAVGLLPFIFFGMSYDWMRLLPNYMVNPIDIADLYNLEKTLFGIHIDGKTLIPCEFFAIHTSVVADFLSGIFYLAWVPVPVAFAVYLYLTNRRDYFVRFSLVFLFVNLLGFACYYIHPAAPPWYAMYYGFEPILDTPGNMAGLVRFDALIGFGLFDGIYGRNANVFAAVPSLHSAYLLIALFYAIRAKVNKALTTVIAVFVVGIWFTAVYTGHHYIIDVVLGILCAIVGIAIFEFVLMKTKWFKNFFGKYCNYIR